MNHPSSPKTRIAQALLIVFILAVIYFFLFPMGIRHFGRANSQLAENVSNGRQVKLTMDAYAMDNDGEFPSAAHAEFYEIPASVTSNDLFKQLFAGQYTDSFPPSIAYPAKR